MDEKLLLEQIDRFIDENEQAIVEDMARLIAIDSVEAAPAGPGKPFGAGPAKALEAALAIAGGWGLETHTGDGYVGWAQLPGAEEGHIATVTHLDVVPPGEGWNGDPFTLRNQEGWLIGRGIVDDKGPSVLCLYAAKFFKQSGAPLRYGLRVLLGTNEESGMGDLPHYFENNPQPLFAFSPDADFPLCNGEKGQYEGLLCSGPLAGGALLEFSAGLAFNVIPAKASCLLNAAPAALKSTAAVTVAGEGGKARLTASGIGGHSAHPQGTKNAIGVLVDYLLETGLCTPAEQDFLRLMQQVCQNAGGEGLSIQCADEQFGPLTLNGGVVKLEGGRLSLTVDVRYPTATNGAALLAAFEKAAAAHGATFSQHADNKPFFIPADSAPIQTLLASYNDVTGDAGAPFTMGGGTYARHFARAVSFGPVRPGLQLPAFAGPEHAANEGGNLKELLLALKIYILAIWRLQKVDFSSNFTNE